MVAASRLLVLVAFRGEPLLLFEEEVLVVPRKPAAEIRREWEERALRDRLSCFNERSRQSDREIQQKSQKDARWAGK